MSTNEQAAVDRALELHSAGYNCAQCVACACCGSVGLDEDLAFRLMEGFGGGMGEFTQTCGAISGGIATLGFMNSGGLANPRTKQATYELSKELVSRFRQKNGSTFCDDLKGLATNAPLRSCDGCIEDGVRITLDILRHHA